jgi:VCBS repeat-containing protein
MLPMIVTTEEDVASSARLAASDPDGNAIAFSLATAAQHGTAAVTADGMYTYTPAPNYFGADSFMVHVTDTANAQSTGTVTVNVTAVNDLPILTSAVQLVVIEDGTLTSQLTGADIDGDTFTFQYVNGIAHGTLQIDGTGALTYTPDPNYFGLETFAVRLVETSGATTSDQSIGLTVQPVNDAPIATADALRVAATPGTSVVIPVLANDIEPDGQNLIPSVTVQPIGGTLTLNADRELVFNPENGYIGPIEFTYLVNDGNGLASPPVTARAVVGPFENLLFLSDYTTPGVREAHIYDGLTVRRVSDTPPAGGTITRVYYNLDATTLIYTVEGATNDSIYIKPIDGSSAARLVFTSATKSPNAASIYGVLNRDATYLLAYDPFANAGKNYYVVDLATGTTTRLGVNSPQVLDLRVVVFSPVNPTLIEMSGQIGGTVPNTFVNDWHTAFIADAANPATLTQIGYDYSPGEGGSGEGAYFSHDGRYIYYGEDSRIAPGYTINQMYYDRQTQIQGVLLRRATTSERGSTGNAAFSKDKRRKCFAFHEFGVTAIDGLARFYAGGAEEPPVIVSPAHMDTTQCAFAADSRTVVYRHYTAGRVSQDAYASSIDGSGYGALSWPAVAGRKQSGWLLPWNDMSIAVSYFPNNGIPSFAGLAGDFYLIPLDASSPPFLFRTNYVYAGGLGDTIDAKGAFIAHAPTNGGLNVLELMSTKRLNYSIPLSRGTETLGVSQLTWLRVWD